jgi:hypothetical protein
MQRGNLNDLLSYILSVKTSPRVGTIVVLALFFTGLVISLIATVFITDGSLKNFYAEQEQIEAERKGREYIKFSLRGDYLQRRAEQNC